MGFFSATVPRQTGWTTPGLLLICPALEGSEETESWGLPGTPTSLLRCLLSTAAFPSVHWKGTDATGLTLLVLRAGNYPAGLA